jgi:hypothetical protein
MMVYLGSMSILSILLSLEPGCHSRVGLPSLALVALAGSVAAVANATAIAATVASTVLAIPAAVTTLSLTLATIVRGTRWSRR